MRVFDLGRMRSILPYVIWGGVVVGLWALWIQFPSPFTEKLFQAALVVGLGSMVYERLLEWFRKDDPSDPDQPRGSGRTEGAGDPPRLELLQPAGKTLRQPATERGETSGTTGIERGEFFRTPPAWVDFEENYVVEHPMLESLVEDVTRHDGGLFVVEGDPASGKSYLLLSLARRLLSDVELAGRRVCDLRLKDVDRSRLDRLATEIESLPDGAYVLVDDVHLEPVDLITVAERFATEPVTLVFATRPVQNYPRNQDDRLASFTTGHYQISAETVAGSLVETFLETEGLSGDRLTAIKEQCMEYKDDLYMLSTALLAYRESGTVSETSIYEWIADAVLDTDEYGDELVDPAPILIAIACLSRFEVSVTKPFLTSYLGLSESALQTLVREGEVLKPSGNTYALHHSSIAQLVIEAAQREAHHSIPPELRRLDRSGPLAWHEAAVQSYIEQEPHLSIEVLAGISRTMVAGRKLATTLLDRLDPSTLSTGIDPYTTTVENLGSFFYLYLGRDDPPPAAVVDRLDGFAREYEGDNASAWAWATDVLARLDIDSAEEFGDRLSPLLASARPQLAADVLTTISYGDPSLAEAIAASLDPNRIETQLESDEMSPDRLAMIVAKLVWVHPGQFTRLATTFSGRLLDLDPVDFPVVLCRIAWGNQESASRMVDSLDRADIVSYVAAIDDDRTYYRALAAMYLVNPTFVSTLSTALASSRITGASGYRRAALNLTFGSSSRPVEGLQSDVVGPARTRSDPRNSATYRALEQCARVPEADRDKMLASIAESNAPLRCLVAAMLLPAETADRIGPRRLDEWVTEDVGDELPSHFVETVSLLVASPRSDTGVG